MGNQVPLAAEGVTNLDVAWLLEEIGDRRPRYVAQLAAAWPRRNPAPKGGEIEY